MGSQDLAEEPRRQETAQGVALGSPDPLPGGCRRWGRGWWGKGCRGQGFGATHGGRVQAQGTRPPTSLSHALPSRQWAWTGGTGDRAQWKSAAPEGLPEGLQGCHPCVNTIVSSFPAGISGAGHDPPGLHPTLPLACTLAYCSGVWGEAASPCPGAACSSHHPRVPGILPREHGGPQAWPHLLPLEEAWRPWGTVRPLGWVSG